ncbi:MAG: agmatinase [Bacillota bacterium]|jgi:agmatinase
MLNKNIMTFLGCDNEYKDSDIVIFGAPFDSTTSYRPGARFASRSMRAESDSLETYSPYQDKDLEHLNIFDAGDLELSLGDTKIVLKQIEKMTTEILNDGKLPLMLGGEHLVSLGALRALIEKYPDLHIIQFDAHADLRDLYLNDKLSHATVMKRAWDLVGNQKIWQFGIRSGTKAEFQWAEKHTRLQKFNFSGLEKTVEQLQGKPVYFTLDLDVLDPAVLPGTGTPEAGGVSFEELRQAVMLVSKLKLVGCDIVELSPTYDPSGISTVTACKILRELLLAIN